SSGLIVIMTRQLMKQTADILMPVKHLLPDNFHIGINVSAGCFLAAGFEKECLNLVNKLGNDKIKLVLELTERNPIPVTPEARAIFDSLHQHNITFALDDFGTGYATYRYLQAFPVDFIKIDKSFVQMASVDEISGHIVDNIVELARKPGLSIVAEGVETQEQADLMIGKGVHFLQGYLYSPPVPGNKFISEWVMKAGG
ncbi:DNA-binding transcriptional activator/c-di-GMP phosphodiesterase PdeL, partial [Escherichia coli]|nr:DNA-binding transcriptional activator/c-di-GMP phosphodiesterase PdeL [Escherichia coli]